jgi:hypothetical protein
MAEIAQLLPERLDVGAPNGVISKREPVCVFIALAPILFRLSLHCRRRRVLHLDPVGALARTRSIARVQPLGYDPLAAELAGVGEDDVAGSMGI